MDKVALSDRNNSKLMESSGLDQSEAEHLRVCLRCLDEGPCFVQVTLHECCPPEHRAHEATEGTILDRLNLHQGLLKQPSGLVDPAGCPSPHADAIGGNGSSPAFSLFAEDIARLP